MGPHPAVAAVRSAVRRALAEYPTDRPALVACSGGPDSMALAAALAFVAARTGRPAGLVTVDHGLQSGSARQAGQVAEFGYQLGLDPVWQLRVSVGRRGGLEAAARAARYAALESCRGEQALVLLGHTADDQAETVLLGLGRGSGPRSIAGMRPATGGYLRPLLGLRRADTEAMCAALGLPCWQDPHNTDPRFQRSRLRAEVLPLLDDVLQGGVVPALARTAGQLQDVLDALDLLAGTVLASAKSTDGLDARMLAGQPNAVVSRVVKRWAEAAGAGALSAVHVKQLSALVLRWHGQAGVDLPGGRRAVRTAGRLRLINSPEPSGANGCLLTYPGEVGTRSSQPTLAQVPGSTGAEFPTDAEFDKLRAPVDKRCGVPSQLNASSTSRP
ncbi:MAG TPA: tRNA lysidine(34) synthetase TilS [Jatrophihabitans sp.]|nr:tRNA lysidine(34) synthetase TilS [Jatrophihabitans sp.]